MKTIYKKTKQWKAWIVTMVMMFCAFGTAKAGADIEVIDVITNPVNPTSGQTFTAAAIVKNVGDAASSSSQKHGITFTWNGETSWCDTFYGPIPVGGLQLLTVSGGNPGGSKTTWTYGGTSYDMTVHFNDDNSLTEDGGNTALNNYLYKRIFCTPTPYGNGGNPRQTSTTVGQYVQVEAEHFDVGGALCSFRKTNTGGGSGDNDWREASGLAVTMESMGGGNYKVNYTGNGEYLIYTIKVLQTGTYSITSNVTGGNGTFYVQYQITDVLNTVDTWFATSTNRQTIAATGGWSNWQTPTSNVISLPAGTYRFKLRIDGDCNIDWFRINTVSLVPTCTIPPAIDAITDLSLTIPTTPSITLSQDNVSGAWSIVSVTGTCAEGTTNSNQITTSGGNYIFTPNGCGIYTLRYEDGDCSKEFPVYVYPVPVGTATGSGNKITLTFTRDVTLTSTNVANFNLDAAGAGTGISSVVLTNSKTITITLAAPLAPGAHSIAFTAGTIQGAAGAVNAPSPLGIDVCGLAENFEGLGNGSCPGTIGGTTVSTLQNYYGDHNMCSYTFKLSLNGKTWDVKKVGRGTHVNISGRPGANGAGAVSLGIGNDGYVIIPPVEYPDTLVFWCKLSGDPQNELTNAGFQVLVNNIPATKVYVSQSESAIGVLLQEGNTAGANPCFILGTSFIRLKDEWYKLTIPIRSAVPEPEIKIYSRTGSTFDPFIDDIMLKCNRCLTSAYAGSNIRTTMSSVSLHATLPVTGTGKWSVVSAPGTYTFSDVNDHEATFTPSVPGNYILRWSVTFNACTTYDEITVLVTPYCVEEADFSVSGGTSFTAGSISGTGSGISKVILPSTTDRGNGIQPASPISGGEVLMITGSGSSNYAEFMTPSLADTLVFWARITNGELPGAASSYGPNRGFRVLINTMPATEVYTTTSTNMGVKGEPLRFSNASNGSPSFVNSGDLGMYAINPGGQTWMKITIPLGAAYNAAGGPLTIRIQKADDFEVLIDDIAFMCTLSPVIPNTASCGGFGTEPATKFYGINITPDSITVNWDNTSKLYTGKYGAGQLNFYSHLATASTVIETGTCDIPNNIKGNLKCFLSPQEINNELAAPVTDNRISATGTGGQSYAYLEWTGVDGGVGGPATITLINSGQELELVGQVVLTVNGFPMGPITTNSTAGSGFLASYNVKLNAGANNTVRVTKVVTDGILSILGFKLEYLGCCTPPTPEPITIGETPVAGNYYVCPGENMPTFTAHYSVGASTHPETNTIQWWKGEEATDKTLVAVPATSAGTGATYTPSDPVTQPANEGRIYYYYFTVSNGSCADTSAVIRVIVGKPGAPSLTQVVAGACTGDQGLQFAASLEPGTAAADYTWTVPATWTITAAEDIVNATTAHGQNITVTAGDFPASVSVSYTKNGCQSQVLAWPVQPGGISIPGGSVTPPATQNLTVGTAGTMLTVTAETTNGSTIVDYQWYRGGIAGPPPSGGTPIPGANTDKYTPTAVKENADYYYVVVTNSCGATATSNRVQVNGTAQSGDWTACVETEGSGDGDGNDSYVPLDGDVVAVDYPNGLKMQNYNGADGKGVGEAGNGSYGIIPSTLTGGNRYEARCANNGGLFDGGQYKGTAGSYIVVRVRGDIAKLSINGTYPASGQTDKYSTTQFVDIVFNVATPYNSYPTFGVDGGGYQVEISHVFFTTTQPVMGSAPAPDIAIVSLDYEETNTSLILKGITLNNTGGDEDSDITPSNSKPIVVKFNIDGRWITVNIESGATLEAEGSDVYYAFSPQREIELAGSPTPYTLDYKVTYGNNKDLDCGNNVGSEDININGFIPVIRFTTLTPGVVDAESLFAAEVNYWNDGTATFNAPYNVTFELKNPRNCSGTVVANQVQTVEDVVPALAPGAATSTVAPIHTHAFEAPCVNGDYTMTVTIGSFSKDYTITVINGRDLDPDAGADCDYIDISVAPFNKEECFKAAIIDIRPGANNSLQGLDPFIGDDLTKPNSAVWGDVPATYVQYRMTNVGSTQAAGGRAWGGGYGDAPVGYWKAAYDEDHLFIIVECYESNARNDNNDVEGGFTKIYEGSTVEILTFVNNVYTQNMVGYNSAQIVGCCWGASANNDIRFMTNIIDQNNFLTGANVKYVPTANYEYKESGYVLAFSIPWTKLGTTPTNVLAQNVLNMEVGITIAKTGYGNDCTKSLRAGTFRSFDKDRNAAFQNNNSNNYFPVPMNDDICVEPVTATAPIFEITEVKACTVGSTTNTITKIDVGGSFDAVITFSNTGTGNVASGTGIKFNVEFNGQYFTGKYYGGINAGQNKVFSLTITPRDATIMDGVDLNAKINSDGAISVADGSQSLCMLLTPSIAPVEVSHPVRKIIWTDYVPGRQHWDVPENWLHEKADRNISRLSSSKAFHLSSDVIAVIPAGLDHYPEYPTAGDFYGDVKHKGGGTYIDQIYVEADAAVLMEPFEGTGFGEKYRVLHTALKVNSRDGWLMVGPNVCQITRTSGRAEVMGQKDMISGHYYLNDEPHVYMRPMILADSPDVVEYGITFPHLEISIHQDSAFFIKTPNEYGPYKFPADIFYSGSLYGRPGFPMRNEERMANAGTEDVYILFENARAQSDNPVTFNVKANEWVRMSNVFLANISVFEFVRIFGGQVASWNGSSFDVSTGTGGEYIKPMEAFFFKGTSTGTITLKESEICDINIGSPERNRARSAFIEPEIVITASAAAGGASTKAAFKYDSESRGIVSLFKLFIGKDPDTGDHVSDIFSYTSSENYYSQAFTNKNAQFDLGINMAKAKEVIFTVTGTEDFEQAFLDDKELGVSYNLKTTAELPPVDLIAGRNKDRFVLRLVAFGEIDEPCDTPDCYGTTDNPNTVAENGLKIYTEDNRNVIVSAQAGQVITAISIVDMAGRVVNVKPTAESYTRIDMGNYPAGIYSVKATTDAETKAVKIAIK